MWVAIDRAIRLADKRSFPCPNRMEWYKARDQLYEDVMNRAWNKKEKFFAQSYEAIDTLDSAVLIMPLVFFSSAVGHISPALCCCNLICSLRQTIGFSVLCIVF